ncbi:calcium-binding protein [Oxynema sp. CENA135]|uniref:calcium-binding protein n=1 Tax=Oxynema sp. CENA135 TaxID=984206 RepID=UPI00190DAE31|nr:calcium-binding protein [Oxynema sp. CENA135]MBK4728542.1 calcium-binding protein [Oxynema sp. CENA135]
MRILVTIPHVFDPNGGGNYGSLSPDPQPRIKALTQCLRSLHSLFNHKAQFCFEYRDRLYTLPANQGRSVLIQVIICTTQGLHLLDRLPIPSWSYQHHEVNCHPMLVGFECHALLREHLGQYDYYCYLEDDLILSDPEWFVKLGWFNHYIGDRAVLHPNRFEIVNHPEIKKIYIDPELEFKTGKKDNFAHYFSDNLTIAGNVMGQQIIINRAENPHSGCFFLNHRQMADWASRDYFLDGDSRFFGPLESAATLGIARTFRVYKPAASNANFLEIQHFGQAWSEKIKAVKFT